MRQTHSWPMRFLTRLLAGSSRFIDADIPLGRWWVPVMQFLYLVGLFTLTFAVMLGYLFWLEGRKVIQSVLSCLFALVGILLWPLMMVLCILNVMLPAIPGSGCYLILAETQKSETQKINYRKLLRPSTCNVL